MTEPDQSPSSDAAGTGPRPAEWHLRYRTLPTGERPPAVLDALTGGAPAELVWRNEAGGQTWRSGDRFLKWSPDPEDEGIAREIVRLRRLAGVHPVPPVIDHGGSDDGCWILTAALAGSSATEDRWRADPGPAVISIAVGLRRMHDLPPSAASAGWTSWVTRAPAVLGSRPPVERAVVVHGDACAPNTLLDAAGGFLAHVDLADTALGDRWADLAVASMSLGWNYGPGWEPTFFAAYGIDPDPVRIAYYRSLWDLES